MRSKPSRCAGTQVPGHWLVGVLVLALLACACSADSGSSPAIDTTTTTAPPTASSGAAAEATADSLTAESAAPVMTCPTHIGDPLALWAEAGFSGALVFVSDPNRFDPVDCRVGFGSGDGDTITPDSVFSLGSVTKTFTAVAIFALVEDGALGLDSTAGQFLPQLDPAVAGLTIEQLLTHTSGLADNHGGDYEPLSLDQAVATIGNQDLLFEPGERYGYSNSGYTLLAAIIESAHGSYRDFMVRRVLTLPNGTIVGGFWEGEPAPLGPRAVGYLDHGEQGEIGSFAGPYWALEGAGGIAMAANELEVWARELAAGNIITADSLNSLIGLAEATTEPFVSLGGGGDVGHDVALVIHQNRDVLVIASNTPVVTAEDLLRLVEPSIHAGEPITPPAQVIPIDATTLDLAAGEYKLADGSTLSVDPSGTGLAVSASRGLALRSLYPIPSGYPIDVDGHEALVTGFYQGLTAEGREELAILRDDAGLAFDSEIPFEIVGSAFITPEIRTYVAIGEGSQTFQCWVALDELGSVAGLDCAGGPPARHMVAIGASQFAPANSPSGDANPTISFSKDTATIATQDGTLKARR